MLPIRNVTEKTGERFTLRLKSRSNTSVALAYKLFLTSVVYSLNLNPDISQFQNDQINCKRRDNLLMRKVNQN